jgi:hypothetical protein
MSGATEGVIEMAIDDKGANLAAEQLESKLQSKDYVGLHNLMVEQSQAYDKDSFNKIMSVFGKLNNDKASNDSQLPTVEIHNDGFLGFGGSTDQVILKDKGQNGKKMEIFESPAHYQAEAEENLKQAEPLHIDFFHNRDKAASNDWVGSRPDFQTNSSVLWEQNSQSTPLNSVVNHMNGTMTGAYDNGGVRINSDQDLQNILNHPPKGY